MGIFSFLKTSFKKSNEINRISKILGDMRMPTLQDLLSDNNKREEAEKRLYDLIDGNKELKSILVKHGADREMLNDVYITLTCNGAGQWVKGHYIAVSALAFQGTLDFILQNCHKMKISEEVRLRVVYRLIRFFERGEVRPIHPDDY